MVWVWFFIHGMPLLQKKFGVHPCFSRPGSPNMTLSFNSRSLSEREYAQDVRRGNPLAPAVVAQMGMDAEAVNKLFRAAARL